MGDSNNPRTEQSLRSRREWLKYVGLVGASGGMISLAGCGGGGGEGGGGGDGGDGGNGGSSGGDGGGGGGGGGGGSDLGPEVVVDLNYWTAASFETKIQQDTIGVVQENLENIGISTNLVGRDIPTSIDVIYNDRREELPSAAIWGHGPDPARIDPHEFCRRNAIDWAGPTGLGNVGNYASCEYSSYAIGQAQASSEQERRDWVYRAQQIMSEDKAIIPIGAQMSFGAYREDAVEVRSIGNIGINNTNAEFFMDSTPIGKDNLVADARPETFQNAVPITSPDPEWLTSFMRMVASPLVGYTSGLELTPVLAEEIPEFEDDGTTMSITLKDGLTFQNGDELTADAVKFTMDFAQANHRDFPLLPTPGHDQVTVVDDRTVEIDFGEPQPSFLSAWMPKWGILHQPSMEAAGAVENPTAWDPAPEDVVGSGPYVIDQFDPQRTIVLTPWDGDHVDRNPEHTIFFRGFSNAEGITRALSGGELDVGVSLTGGNLQALEGESGIATSATPGFGAFLIYPETHVAPMKFPAFRDAVGTVIDRQTINEIAFNGQNDMETRPTMFNKQHPWRAPDDMLFQYTDDLSGDPEAARQKLQDAGFEYDDDGNLHYPPDANLDPLWPAGEFPSEEHGFPCVNSDGEYIGELPD